MPDVAKIILGLLFAGGVGIGAYALVPKTLRTKCGWITLGIVWLALSIGLCINLWHWTLGGLLPLEHPLMTNFDYWFYRDTALVDLGMMPERHYQSNIDMTGPRHYSVVLMVCAMLFGRSVLPPLLINVVAMLWAVIVTGLLAARIVPAGGRMSRNKVAALAMIVVSALAYWLNSGTILLKDALLEVTVPTVLLAITTLHTPCHNRAFNIILRVAGFAALCLIAVIRVQFLLIMAVAVVFTIRCKSTKSVANCALLALLMVGMYLPSKKYIVKSSISITEYNTEKIAKQYVVADTYHQAYQDIFGEYMERGMADRIKALPLTVGVQYFIPLPWNVARDISQTPTFAYARQGWVWYFVGGATIWYLFALSWRRRQRVLDLARFAWWGASYWVFCAWYVGGTVSRYLLPLMPVYVCMAIAAVLQSGRKRAFRLYYLLFIIALIAALSLMWYLS